DRDIAADPQIVSGDHLADAAAPDHGAERITVERLRDVVDLAGLGSGLRIGPLGRRLRRWIIIERHTRIVRLVVVYSAPEVSGYRHRPSGRRAQGLGPRGPKDLARATGRREAQGRRRSAGRHRYRASGRR